MRLDTQLSSSPVSSLGVVSDRVVSLQSDPLRQWSVLLLGLSQLLLDLETLVSLKRLVFEMSESINETILAHANAKCEQKSLFHKDN